MLVPYSTLSAKRFSVFMHFANSNVKQKSNKHGLTEWSEIKHKRYSVRPNKCYLNLEILFTVPTS